MSHRTLLTISLSLLVLVGIRMAWSLPALYASDMAMGGSQALAWCRITGSLFFTVIWFFLALIQWQSGGRWGLGIAIVALIVLSLACALMVWGVASGRVHFDALSIAKFVIFSLVFGVLAFVNFWLYALQKQKQG
ncbi:MAG TPA: hypothetical protein VMO20_05910 [Candidatus Acidoferrum sp.]|nr:hypothetical protein [Candidatus Acidoferrum sp.]